LDSNQIPEGTSRLAGGPYLHQGLSSIECGRTAVPWGSHTIYSPFCVHDGLRSHYLLCIRQVLYQLSYVNLCGLGRVRSYNPRINSAMLYQLSYQSVYCGSRWNRTTKTMFYRHDQDPADTPLFFVSPIGFEPMTPPLKVECSETN